MSTQYIEIKRTRRGVNIGVYTPEQYIAKRRLARGKAKRAARRAAITERLGAIVAMLGLLLMLGGAGSADCNTAPLWQCLAWSWAGLALMAAGAYLAHAFYGQEELTQWRK